MSYRYRIAKLLPPVEAHYLIAHEDTEATSAAAAFLTDNSDENAEYLLIEGDRIVSKFAATKSVAVTIKGATT